MTWSEMLTRLRVIHAVQLLADGNLSIIQIAGDEGLSLLSAFNRNFRRWHTNGIPQSIVQLNLVLIYIEAVRFELESTQPLRCHTVRK